MNLFLAGWQPGRTFPSIMRSGGVTNLDLVTFRSKGIILKYLCFHLRIFLACKPYY